MISYVEHVNLTISNTDDTLKFIQSAVPDFFIRNRWEAEGYEWTHIGTETTYLALMKPLDISDKSNEVHQHDTGRIGYNHVCIVVTSVERVRDALFKEGFKRGFNNGEIISTSVRKSVYFHDPDDNEFEFMEYLTDNMDKRNLYIN